jgi:hypothetical protein
MAAAVTRSYAVRSGRRIVATRSALSAHEAALDYLRSIGCKRDEIMYHGVDGAAWRGAVYRAEAVDGPPDGRLN